MENHVGNIHIMLIAEGSDSVLKCDYYYSSLKLFFLSVKSLHYTLFMFPIIYFYFSFPTLWFNFYSKVYGPDFNRRLTNFLVLFPVITNLLKDWITNFWFINWVSIICLFQSLLLVSVLEFIFDGIFEDKINSLKLLKTCANRAYKINCSGTYLKFLELKISELL